MDPLQAPPSCRWAQKWTRNLSTVTIILFLVMALVQVSVAVGVVPVHILWGGSYRTLTWPLRCASLLAACLLAGMAVVFEKRAKPSPSLTIQRLSWVITVFMIVNTMGNLASKHRFEENIFSAFTIVLFICCGILSASPVEEYEAIEPEETILF